MSGVPPHHTRPVRAAANSAWNHLQVPNFFPRAPQHAHIQPSDHPLAHQPTWHTPTTSELPSTHPYSHVFNLEQMLSEPFKKLSPGVDLSVTRTTQANGNSPTSAPISLSVRDTHKINSLAVSALKIQEKTLRTASPTTAKPPSPAKCASPGTLPGSVVPKPQPAVSPSPTLAVTTTTTNTSTTSIEQQVSPKVKKVKRVDSILERLNPQVVDSNVVVDEKPASHASSHDENSNSSSILLNVPTAREDEVVSPYYSNDDSLDSNRSRRKRKPAKTMKVPPPVAIEACVEKSPVNNNVQETVEVEKKVPERRKTSPEPSAKSRDGSSEDETIDKIAAMVSNADKDTNSNSENTNEIVDENCVTEVSAASPCPRTSIVVTLAQKKDFVAVEDKLEEMFAGLEEPKANDDNENETMTENGFNNTEELLDLENTPSTSQALTSNNKARQKGTNKKRKQAAIKGGDSKKQKTNKSFNKKNKKLNNLARSKLDSIRDVYAYDSGSNASSSVKSKGPFIHINGPRESPLNVSVINAPLVNEDDAERKGAGSSGAGAGGRAKKFHDDSEYRHKVRSKGLHCSTLSNKYDAQTKDVSWICVFCKRGPYSGEFASTSLSLSSSEYEYYYTPGDLFGPYVITNTCAEFDRRLDDPYDAHFKSKKIARTVVADHPRRSATTSSGSSGRRKHAVSESGEDAAHSRESNVVGIAPLSDERNFEIWAHEDCIVWSPGIYLIGAKIVGLEEAVWLCSNVQCTRCHDKGANICCLRRGCPNVMHLGCAHLSKWHLEENNYKAYCPDHRHMAAAAN